MDINDYFLIALLSIGEFRLKDFALFLWNAPLVSYVGISIGLIMLTLHEGHDIGWILWGFGWLFGSIIFAIFWTIQFGYV